MRAARHIWPFLLFAVACGRGEFEQLLLTPPSGSDGSVSDGSTTDPRDGGIVGPTDGFVRDSGSTNPPPPPPPPPPPRDAGTPVQCMIDADCFRALGQPQCPNGQRGDWDCVRNFCELRCDMPPPPECFNDCDCPFELSCARGECRPLNRNNRCCANPNCPPGDTCQLPGGGTSICPEPPPPPVDAGVPDGGPPPSPDGGVTTPVGAPCAGMNMCGPGQCIEAQSGFPGGYCTQDCGPGGMACPGDADCRSFGPGQQLCLDGCQVSADCRMGYNCVQLGIDPDKVCWPVSGGSMNPNGAPVGSPCSGDGDCITGLTCVDFQGWPGGYCTIPYCDPQNNPCPSMSSCYAFPGLFSMCLEHCPSGGSQSTCRNGYYCLGPTGQQGACVPN